MNRKLAIILLIIFIFICIIYFRYKSTLNGALSNINIFNKIKKKKRKNKKKKNDDDSDDDSDSDEDEDDDEDEDGGGESNNTVSLDKMVNIVNAKLDQSYSNALESFTHDIKNNRPNGQSNTQHNGSGNKPMSNKANSIIKQSLQG